MSLEKDITEIKQLLEEAKLQEVIDPELLSKFASSVEEFQSIMHDKPDWLARLVIQFFGSEAPRKTLELFPSVPEKTNLFNRVKEISQFKQVRSWNKYGVDKTK